MNVWLQDIPSYLNFLAIGNAVNAINGVIEVHNLHNLHNLHIWQLWSIVMGLKIACGAK